MPMVYGHVILNHQLYHVIYTRVGGRPIPIHGVTINPTKENIANHKTTPF